MTSKYNCQHGSLQEVCEEPRPRVQRQPNCQRNLPRKYGKSVLIFTSFCSLPDRFSSHFSQALLLPPQPWQHGESAKPPSSLLAFTSCNMKLTILDSFIAAPRSEWQSRSSSSAEEDMSSSSLEGSTALLPTQLIIRATFPAILARNLNFAFSAIKLNNPKLSKRTILTNHFSITGLQLLSHSQPTSRQVHPTSAGWQQRAPHNHLCDLYTSIMLTSEFIKHKLLLQQATG